MTDSGRTGGRFVFLRAPLLHLSNNPLSLGGVVLVTSAAVLWLLLLPIYVRGFVGDPYAGILIFLVLPTAFFLGLALIPAGIYLRRRRHPAEAAEETFPVAWTNPDLRRIVYFIGATTAANLIIGVQLTYSAVSYMDTVTFCGLTCHRIMKPEYTAYQGSPHSRVECVQCHIGPGASWFVRSKLSGLQQVINYALNTYPRPIPTPVHNLRPARETCEACHWPARFDGDRLRIITKATEDEKNTLTKTVLLMHIGGGSGGPGIHGHHIGRGVTVEYASDATRQNIPWIQYRDAAGKVTVFSSGDLKPGAEKTMEHRVMDCIDCHNRPTHNYELPERALDEAISGGRIPQSLPFVRKQGLVILKVNYKTREEAETAIPAALAAFYQRSYPQVASQNAADVRRAGQGLLDIYDRNVYPEMRITWGTYPNNLGHVDFPGCFRCHDGSHASASGDAITQDCEACHHVLAVDEPSPKVLVDLGVSAQ